MVVLREVEVFSSWVTGRHRGWGFGALARVIGKTAEATFLKYGTIVANRVSADSFEYAAPELAQVLVVENFYKKTAKHVGGQLLRKQ